MGSDRETTEMSTPQQRLTAVLAGKQIPQKPAPPAAFDRGALETAISARFRNHFLLSTNGFTFKEAAHPQITTFRNWAELLAVFPGEFFVRDGLGYHFQSDVKTIIG